MSTETILIAFGLTLVAGLSTGIGSMLAFFTKRTNTKFLATSLGFSAGVMIYVSFMEMMPQAKLNLIESFGDRIGTFYLLLAFFGGMGMITLTAVTATTFLMVVTVVTRLLVVMETAFFSPVTATIRSMLATETT